MAKLQCHRLDKILLSHIELTQNITRKFAHLNLTNPVKNRTENMIE